MYYSTSWKENLILCFWGGVRENLFLLSQHPLPNSFLQYGHSWGNGALLVSGTWQAWRKLTPKLSCRAEKPGRPCCLQAVVVSPISNMGLSKNRSQILARDRQECGRSVEIMLSCRATMGMQSSWACPVWNNWSRTWPLLRKGPWSRLSWKPLTKPGTWLPSSVPTTSAKMHLTWEVQLTGCPSLSRARSDSVGLSLSLLTSHTRSCLQCQSSNTSC